MTYTFETDRYNERRYGKPWMAFVTNNLTKGFAFIEWNGRPGHAGDFTFDAEPGTIVAEGQQDHRKGRGGIDHYRVLLPDGTSIDTNLLAISDGKLLAMKPEARWKYAVKERLGAWAADHTPGKSAKRWEFVAQYSRLLGVANPLMMQAAKDLGLIVEQEFIAAAVSVEAFF